jgi:hypothetical protein
MAFQLGARPLLSIHVDAGEVGYRNGGQVVVLAVNGTVNLKVAAGASLSFL